MSFNFWSIIVFFFYAKDPKKEKRKQTTKLSPNKQDACNISKQRTNSLGGIHLNLKRMVLPSTRFSHKICTRVPFPESMTKTHLPISAKKSLNIPNKHSTLMHHES